MSMGLQALGLCDAVALGGEESIQVGCQLLGPILGGVLWIPKGCQKFLPMRVFFSKDELTLFYFGLACES